MGLQDGLKRASDNKVMAPGHFPGVFGGGSGNLQTEKWFLWPLLGSTVSEEIPGIIK